MVSQKSASIREVVRNYCLLILHHRSLAVAQTNVPGTHTSINTTQDLFELCTECMQNWMQAVITVIIHYTLCVRSQRLVSEVDTGLIAFVSLQFGERNEMQQKEILLIWLRLCHRWWTSNVDAAGAKEQCAEAGAEEPVPEEQEGASTCQRKPTDTPTQTWQGCLRVSMHHTYSYRNANPLVRRNLTVVDSHSLCWCIYFLPPIKTDGRMTVSEPDSES